MLTRFKMNVTKYPRLAVAWLVLLVIAVAENVVLPRLVGIEHALLGDAVVALVLAGLIYLWIVRSGSRTSWMVNVLDALEGRTACGGDSAPEDEIDYDENTGCGDENCTACHPVQDLINDERGQDVAEYAVMLAVMLVIVIGVLRLIGGNAANVISAVGSQIQ